MPGSCRIIPENVITNCYCTAGDLTPLVRKLIQTQGENLLELHMLRDPFSAKYSVKIVTGGVE